MTIMAAASVSAAIKPDIGTVGVANDIEVHSTTASPAGCFSGIRFNSDGTMDEISDGSGSTYSALGSDNTGYHDNSDVSTGGEIDHTGEWYSAGPAAGVGSSFDISMTINTGTFGGINDLGVSVAWFSLGTSREVATTRDGGKGGLGAGTTRATATVQIRNSTTLTVLTTFDIDCISHRLV